MARASALVGRFRLCRRTAKVGLLSVFRWFGWGVLMSQFAAAADKYLLLNYSPSGSFSPSGSTSANVMGYVASKFGAANQTSALKVGVSCLYIPGWNGISSELALLQSDLALAQSSGVPILVQVDTETWLPTSLLNWYDPALPGYDLAKKADVEWYGWDDSTAVKLSWRNWGFPFRIGPTPNFLSANFQAYEKGIYDQFLPVVLNWYNNLPANKKWLFAGWKCGWESAINSNYRFFPNGNSYYGTSNDPVWSDNYQPLGYNAAQTAGIRTSGTLTSADNAKIVGKHLTYLAKMACDAGLPREKISVHGTFYGTTQEDVDALVNPYGNPGASFYGSSGSPLKSNTALMQAVQTAKSSYGASGYAYGEFNLFTTDYNTWYSWFRSALHDDQDCVYQALYNFDTMHGQAGVEQAMLDAMALYPAPPPPADGTWSNDGDGLWSVAANWNGGTVADGAGFSADFHLIDVTGDRTVHLDSALSIGNLFFGDTNIATAAGWTLDNNGNAANVLTLAGTTPTVTVGTLGSGKVAAITAVIAGTSGLVKAGAGRLVLAGSNTYSGTTSVNAGQLAITAAGSINSASTVIVNPNTTLVIGQGSNGNPLILNGGLVTVPTVDNTGSGGTITYSGGNVVHAFTTTGTSSLDVPTPIPNASVLVVAGGGGGGWNCGGGGGAGGLLYYGPESPANGHAEGMSYAIAAGSIVVTVGTGGAAGIGSSEHGGSGGDSCLGPLQAIGGGGGAGRDYGIGNNTTGGSPGGSGGGGSGCSGNIVVSYAGSGTSGQGLSGGIGTTDYGINSAAGGGGGAGADGGAGSQSGPGGNGGVGLRYSLSGSPVWYAGGGAGLGYQQGGALGGSGGGGNQSQAATPNTGGGGGGGGGNAGVGGSGIVIVRYPYVNAPTATILSGTIAVPVTSTLDAVGSGGRITVASGMTGAGGVTIASSTDPGGIVTFAVAQSYGGPTVITSGTLKLDGSLTLPSNAALDLDANVGVSTGTGGQVTSWADQSGSGNHAIGVSGAYPTLVTSGINGHPVVRFNGNSRMTDPLSASIGSAETILGVIVGNSSSQLGTIVGPAGGDGIQLRLANGQLNLLRENTQGLGTSSGTLATGTPAIVAATTTSGSQAFYINGTPAGTSGAAYAIVQPDNTSAIGYNWYGPGEFLNGCIAELLVYPRVLSAAELAQANACLQAKWLGIGPVNLLPATTPLTVSANATLDLGGVSQQVASLDGGGSIINSNSGTASVLTVSPAGGLTSFSGAIGGGGGTLSLVKSGNGIQVISGSNTYTGATTVNGGILRVQGSLGNTPTSVAATLAGNGSINASVHLLAGGGFGARIADWTGVAGSGFEDLAVQSLAIDPGGHTVTVDTAGLAHFSEASKTFAFLTTLAGISGVTASDFTVFAPGFPGTGTWSVRKSANNLNLEIVYTTAFDIWATAKGLDGSAGKENGPNDDPDHDGRNNLFEFACNGNPLSAADNGKVFVFSADNAANKALILTVAVRAGTPVFNGEPSPAASRDGVTYVIEGSNDLGGFPAKVNVLATPVVTSLPDLTGSGYEYRSFSLDGSSGLTGKGFLRAKISR